MDNVQGKEGIGEVRVQCFPFYSLLSAMDVKVVDYFSLDVEGMELEVLETIPFDKIRIRVLSVEYIHDSKGSGEIIKFMETKNFRLVSNVTNGNNFANDFGGFFCVILATCYFGGCFVRFYVILRLFVSLAADLCDFVILASVLCDFL